MKRLVALMMCAVSLGAAAQFPSLPYNPDENGDGLIGVVDLQGLLSNYGSDFSSAVLSDDGESALVYMGELGYFACEYSCDQLPGFWTLPSGKDLIPIFPELNQELTYTWLNKKDYESDPWNRFPVYRGSTTKSERHVEQFEDVDDGHGCYCVAKQLPRVEYTWCYNQVGDLQACAQEKVELGWIPIGGISTVYNSGGSNGVNSFQVASQAFWRWAE